MTPEIMQSLIMRHVTHSQRNSPAKRRHLLALCQAIRREALKEATALATERTKMYTDFSTSWHVAADCANAIRALADAPNSGAGG